MTGWSCQNESDKVSTPCFHDSFWGVFHQPISLRFCIHVHQTCLQHTDTSKHDRLTFNANYMLPNLLLDERIRNGLDQIVDGIDARMYALKSLNFLPYGQGIVEIRLHMSAGVHCALLQLSPNPWVVHGLHKSQYFSSTFPHNFFSKWPDEQVRLRAEVLHLSCALGQYPISGLLSLLFIDKHAPLVYMHVSHSIIQYLKF